MPMPEHLRPLVTKLLEASDDGRVLWQEGKAEDRFRVTLQSSTILLRSAYSRDAQEWFFEIEILNSQGKIAESWTEYEGGADYKMFERLYASARRKARDVDRALDEIKKQLESGGQIGSAPEGDIPF